MALEAYRKKRDFRRTPEPRGELARARGDAFVVQKHEATRLHYDFRLELDGVLKSWAVPKGPSLIPGDKRLAVETEEHPLAYADFEGVIPEGEYGGGSVLVWDRGRWEPIGDPRKGYAKGHLEFRLHGDKLRGAWHLVRLRQRGEERHNWLLFKSDDEAASERDITRERPESVLSGRTLEAVAKARDRVWHSDGGEEKPRRQRRRPRREERHLLEALGAARGKLPDFVAPELATLVTAVPHGRPTLCEVKLDGYRLMARLERGGARLATRTGLDWSERFTPIVRALSRLGREAYLDGEVVALGEGGASSFQRLQNAMRAGASADIVYYAFDLLFLDGFDLRPLPLSQRRELLGELWRGVGDPLRLSAVIPGDWRDVLREACQLGLEGIIAKAADSPYRSARTRDWLKLKCGGRQELLVVGYTDPQGTRRGFGALLLAVRAPDGALRFAGKVGTGFDERDIAALHPRLIALQVSAPPVEAPPKRKKGVHWVRPELVVEVGFAEWTKDGLLRHPTFRGVREDKPARSVTREVAAPPTVAGSVAGVRLTHPERVLYRAQGISKHELASYLEAVAPLMLPHVARRPLMLERCPEGDVGGCFFQKHAGPGTPRAIHRHLIREGTGRKPSLYVDSVAGLVSLAQIGALAVHTWQSRIDALEHPDQLVFDLDPDVELDWREVVRAARSVREALDELGLASFVKTSGGKGLHVVLPLSPQADFAAAGRFAERVTELVCQQSGGRYVAVPGKSRRRGKLFIDYLRNRRGATAVAPYSTRARPLAPVSMPVEWDELDDVRADSFTLREVLARLGRRSRDPWRGMLALGQSLAISPR